MVAGSATASWSGCAKSSGDAEEDAPPDERRDDRVERRSSTVATVSGSRTAKNGGGAPTISSSVPCQRCHWIAPPDPKRVADQMPISPAPSAT